MTVAQLPIEPIYHDPFTQVYRWGSAQALKLSVSAVQMVAAFSMAIAAHDCAVKHLALVEVGPRGPRGIAMELCSPVTIEAAGTDRAGIAKQLIDVVERLHRRSIIHGDIKLSNFLICRDGRIRLSDFALARYDDNMEEESTMSIPWCSRRLCNPSRYYPRTAADDLHSLGKTIWELYSGRFPHTAPGEAVEGLDDEDFRDRILAGDELDMAEITDADVRELARNLMAQGT